MEKCSIIMLASTLCFLSLLGSAYSSDRLIVEGVVYCDTCRLQFITRLSEFLEGATVQVECKEEGDGNKVTFSKEAKTDAGGRYRVAVHGDHEDEVCAVKLISSPKSECSEIDKGSHLDQAARISITKNNGIVSPIRQANPLGFLRNDRLPACSQVLQELGVHEDGTPV